MNLFINNILFTIFQLMIKCPSLNLSSWYQAFDLSQKDPRFVLDHLIDSGEVKPIRDK